MLLYFLNPQKGPLWAKKGILSPQGSKICHFGRDRLVFVESGPDPENPYPDIWWGY